MNLGAFYLVGVPIGVVLGFVAHFKAKGLWIGIVAGSVVQTLFLSIIASLTNWKKQVHNIVDRFDYTTLIQFDYTNVLKTEPTKLFNRLNHKPTSFTVWLSDPKVVEL